jgi:hypothetical protein
MVSEIQVPPKIKTFMWLLLHNRLHTTDSHTQITESANHLICIQGLCRPTVPDKWMFVRLTTNHVTWPAILSDDMKGAQLSCVPGISKGTGEPTEKCNPTERRNETSTLQDTY